MKASLKFLVVPLAVGALFFAGCGGDDSSDDNSSSDTATTQSQPADNSMGSGQVLNLAADPSGQLAYDKTELSAKAGKVTLDFTNESPIGHNVVIEDSSGKEIASTDRRVQDQARHVHLLLLDSRSRAGWHEGHSHRPVRSPRAMGLAPS